MSNLPDEAKVVFGKINGYIEMGKTDETGVILDNVDKKYLKRHFANKWNIMPCKTPLGFNYAYRFKPNPNYNGPYNQRPTYWIIDTCECDNLTLLEKMYYKVFKVL